MASLAIWIKAVRAPFLTATLVPIMLGSVMAWSSTNSFSWINFFILLVAGVCMHFATNLANDYYDHRSGNDEANKTPTPFSGGSRVIQENLIPALQVRNVSLMLFAVGIGLGLYLNYLLPGNTFLILGIIAFVLGFFYTAPPFKFSYRGLGELAVGIGFGPIILLAAFFAQTGMITYQSIAVSIPIALLIALILLINEFPDHEADRKVRKKTLVVLLGKKAAASLYAILLFSVYVIIVIASLLKLIPMFALITLITIPLALKAITILKKEYNNIESLLPANKLTILLHLLNGTLLVISYLLAHLL